MLKVDFGRFRALVFLFCLPLLPCMAACDGNTVPAGIVATVNGEPIALHSIQGLIDSRTSSTGPGTSVDEMKKNYGHALKLLIIHTLVRQELETNGHSITPEEVENAIQEARDDYGEGGLEAFLADSFIRMEDWRDQMRDHLSLRSFQNDFLLPKIRVNTDEVKDYYNTHKYDFLLPDNLRICLLSAENRRLIADWCSSMDGERFFPGLIGQCMDIKTENAPSEWQKEIRGLSPGKCARAREENGEWRSVALISRNRSRQLSVAEAYALIENILLEQKLSRAFEKWLEQRLEESEIKISPELWASLDLPEAGEKRLEAEKGDDPTKSGFRDILDAPTAIGTHRSAYPQPPEAGGKTH